jgi:hypothetical protein
VNTLAEVLAVFRLAVELATAWGALDRPPPRRRTIIARRRRRRSIATETKR